jgi:hypothetical protein
MAKPDTKHTAQGLTLEQRRAFMQLPLDQRRREMVKQAEQMLKHYQSKEEAAQREQWQGGDIVEP